MDSQRRLVWFRRLSLAGAALAATVVVLGAWVRLTDAGLGCPDWPGCYGHIYPQADHNFSKAIHEMIHRYFASALGAIIFGLLAWTLPGITLWAVVLLFGVYAIVDGVMAIVNSFSGAGSRHRLPGR